MLFLLTLQETLTGFKWMGNKSSELIKAGNVVLFAYEEAIGRLIFLTLFRIFALL